MQFDQKTLVLNDSDACPRKLLRRSLVTDAELHPHNARFGRQNFIDVLRDISGSTEQLHEICRRSDGSQRSMDRDPKYLSDVRKIDRNGYDVVARALHVLGHSIRRPIAGARLDANHGDAMRFFEDARYRRCTLVEQCTP